MDTDSDSDLESDYGRIWSAGNLPSSYSGSGLFLRHNPHVNATKLREEILPSKITYQKFRTVWRGSVTAFMHPNVPALSALLYIYIFVLSLSARYKCYTVLRVSAAVLLRNIIFCECSDKFMSLALFLLPLIILAK